MTCKNCNTALLDSNNYCSNCGAKTIRNRLTLRNLMEDFSQNYFNIDNKFLKTFLHLFSKPEAVIGSYIDGTRKRYVNAISYFAIAITISGLQLFIINKFFPEAMDYSSISRRETEEFNKQLMNFLQEYQTLVMMFYIPFYALISKVVFINYKKYNYTEHLVIFLYAQAQASIFGFFFMSILLLINVPFVAISLVYTFLMFLYMTFVLKRMHGLTIMETILKVLIFILILGALLLIPIAIGIYHGIQQASLNG